MTRMGAEESSLLQDIYIDESEAIELNKSDWKLYKAHHLTDGTKYSAFVNSDENEARLMHAAKQLKLLHHPGIVRYCDLFVADNNTYLITEPVAPLQLTLDDLSPEEIYDGIHDLATALDFLHNKVGLSHNNICMSSVYVGESDGSWKLSGLEYLSTYKQADVRFVKRCRLKQAVIHSAAEEESNTLLPAEFGYSRDVFAFGRLVEELLSSCDQSDIVTDNFINGTLQQMLDSDFHLRPNFNIILEDKIFRNDFLEIKKFLKNLIIMGEDEKSDFFATLTPRLRGLSEQLIAERLLPLLTTRELLAEPTAVQCFLPALFTPRDSETDEEELKQSGILSTALYNKYMLRIIYDLFDDRTTHIRLILLRQAHNYMKLFDTDVLESTLLPEVLVGLKDINDDIVIATLHALATMVPVLGSEVVVGGERSAYITTGIMKGKTRAMQNDHSGSKDISAVLDLNAVSSKTRNSKRVHWLDEASAKTTLPARTTLLKLSKLTTVPTTKPLSNSTRSPDRGGSLDDHSDEDRLESVMEDDEEDDEDDGGTDSPPPSRKVDETINPPTDNGILTTADNDELEEGGDWSDWEDMDDINTVTVETEPHVKPHRANRPDPLEDHEVIEFTSSAPEPNHSPARKDAKLNTPHQGSFALGEEFEIPSEISVVKKTPSLFPELDQLFAELEPKFSKSEKITSSGSRDLPSLPHRTRSHDSLTLPGSHDSLTLPNRTMYKSTEVDLTTPSGNGWDDDTETWD